MARDLGALALAQLQAWEAYAREWPVSVAAKANGIHLVCAVCEMTLLPLTHNKTSYTYTHSITLAATVSHLRNVHRWSEEEAYKNGIGIKDAQAGIGTGDSGPPDIGAPGVD